MLVFRGPIRPSFFLSFDAATAAHLDGADGAARLRVMRDTGYPHDLRVVAAQPSTMRAGRVYAPVVDEGATLKIEVAPESHVTFVILCANCFTQMWSRPMSADDRAGIDAAHADFWASDELRDRGCPNCFAAAAKPH